MIGFCSSPRYVEHQTGPHHPERPDRIRAVHRGVRAAGMIESPDPFPDFPLDLGAVDGQGIKLKELDPIEPDPKWLRSVHTDQHIHRVQHVCEMGGGILDQGDTPVGPKSYEIAMLSLGATLAACDAVMRGEVKRAFAAGRPPGHHAEPDRAMGFCLFGTSPLPRVTSSKPTASITSPSSISTSITATAPRPPSTPIHPSCSSACTSTRARAIPAAAMSGKSAPARAEDLR